MPEIDALTSMLRVANVVGICFAPGFGRDVRDL
jgi:hypothetical protein